MRSGNYAVASSILCLTLIFLAATCMAQTQPTYPPVFNVAAPPYNADPTGNTSSTNAVNAACSAANTAGGGIIYFPAGLFWVDGHQICGSNLVYRGAGIGATTLYAPVLATANQCYQNGTPKGTCIINGITNTSGQGAYPIPGFSNITFEDLTFLGATNVPSSCTSISQTAGSPTGPPLTYSIAYSCTAPTNQSAKACGAGQTACSLTVGAQWGIFIVGSLDTADGSFYPVSKITIRRCSFRNIVGAPVKQLGISEAVAYDNESLNNSDWGFVYDSGVQFYGNTIIGSGDAGLSVTRVNSQAIVSNNVIKWAAQSGISMSIYGATPGSTRSLILGNTITGTGGQGISLDSSPSYIDVIGNHIDKQYQRGTTDTPEDSNQQCILLRGYSGNQINYVDIIGNNLLACTGAGIYVTNSASNIYGVKIANNTIGDTGAPTYTATGTGTYNSSTGVLSAVTGSPTSAWNSLPFDLNGTQCTVSSVVGSQVTVTPANCAPTTSAASGVNATFSGSWATFTSGSAFPSYTTGTLLSGSSFSPTTYDINWTVLSGGGTTSLLAYSSCLPPNCPAASGSGGTLTQLYYYGAPVQPTDISNIGIWLDDNGSTTCGSETYSYAQTDVIGNTVTDSRGTPYMNQPLYPAVCVIAGTSYNNWVMSAPRSSPTAGTPAPQTLVIGGVSGGATTGSATTAGAGSSLFINTGSGGTAASGTNATGGSGGTMNFTAGYGGASSGTAVNSNGGSFIFALGAAGVGGTGTAGQPGYFGIYNASSALQAQFNAYQGGSLAIGTAADTTHGFRFLVGTASDPQPNIIRVLSGGANTGTCCASGLDFGISGVGNLWVGANNETGTWNYIPANSAGLLTSNSYPLYLGTSGTSGIEIDSSQNSIFNGHLNQTGGGRIGGTCIMNSSSKTCTITLGAAFTIAGMCVATPQGTTAYYAACSISGTTLTITANTSMASATTWAAVVIGNPN